MINKDVLYAEFNKRGGVLKTSELKEIALKTGACHQHINLLRELISIR